MKKLFIFFSLCGLFMVSQAQNVGPVEYKDFGYGQKKFSKAPKKIYIAQFRVIYQLMADWTETANGGYQIGGGVRGKATARLAIGLKGIDENDIQGITDDLYTEYIEKLKSEGYEIIPPDEAAKTNAYSDFERKTGGSLSLAQYPGFIMSIPTGYDYFVKRTTKKGIEKKTFLDDSPKLSVELDNAVVAKINLIVKFVSDGESQASKSLGKLAGGVAKLVMETELRLANDPVAGAGAFTTDFAQTQVTYVYATRKMAPDAQCTFQLKKMLPVDGVVEKKKYKSVETADTDYWGTSLGAMRIFSADNRYFENLQSVPVDANAYKKGVEEACKKFLDTTMSDFIANKK